MRKKMFVSGLAFMLALLFSFGAMAAEHGKTDQDKNKVAIVPAAHPAINPPHLHEYLLPPTFAASSRARGCRPGDTTHSHRV